MAAGGNNRPRNLRTVHDGVFLLASPPGRHSTIPECEPDLGEPDEKFAASGPEEEDSVVYNDGNVSITERIEPGLKSITINIGAPPGEVLTPRGQQASSGRKIVSQRLTQAPPLQIEQPQRQPDNQGTAQRQWLPPPPPPQKIEVVIPADSELPIVCNVPQPKGPPPEQAEWPKNSQTYDVCEIQDIDAAANMKTKYGENPCKQPPPPQPKKKDKASNHPSATVMAKSSSNTSPSNDEGQSSKPLVNTDVSDDGCGPSQKSAQPMGRSTADSDISNYGTPGYSGNYTPKKPAFSGGDHDICGRYQAPTPYDPQPPPHHPYPEDDRVIESSGQYAYPPTPPPSGQYPYPPTPPLTPPRGPPEDLPPCPPEGDEYYDAPEDFYYDASSQADWCPSEYTPASQPCNYCHSHFALLENNTSHTGRRIHHIHNAEFQQDKQDSDSRAKSNENEGCNPLLILEQDRDHTVIIRQRKGHHKVGCPWQRKNHHRIEHGDVRNTSFNRSRLEVLDSDDLQAVQRGRARVHMDEQGQVHLNSYWQHSEPIFDPQDGGYCEGEALQYSRDLRPSSDATSGEYIDFFKSHQNSLTCDLTLEGDFEYIHDKKDYVREAAEGSEGNKDELLEPSLENFHATPHPGAELSAMTDHFDVNSFEPCVESDTETDGVFQESHQADCTTPCESCSFYNLNLQRRRSNPALPLILRLGSWVKDVLLPDYTK